MSRSNRLTSEALAGDSSITRDYERLKVTGSGEKIAPATSNDIATSSIKLSRQKNNIVRKRFAHSDYTIAWISALPCEFTAAQAVLDEVHADLVVPPGDDNVYSYGSIANHNIVIACLPAGVYGTVSAAAVASRLLTTFRSIELSLMVGIGGGVPGPNHDIRLGDVVVSTPTPDCPAVIQYDFGKTLQHGRLERKGSLNKPKPKLLKAVNKLRAKHDLEPSKVPMIIADALANETLQAAGYAYPGHQEDILYETSCNHVDELIDCTICGPCQPKKRSVRPDNAPRLHYGSIASGNQVMKNSRVRDEIATPLGILCFEMEAAGLMDDLQCLVVRGICDYCDARKAKGFQNYTALAAAAWAKELLSIFPPSLTSIPKAFSEKEKSRLDAIKECLKFDEAAYRLGAIKNAHNKTCNWLLDDHTFQNWLDDTKLSNHYGLLWIKGKPGAGKSTITKFALQFLRAETNAIVISFFFNARGSELEKSTVGMYRSLLIQMLEGLPNLQHLLSVADLPTRADLWSLELLQDTFKSVARLIGQKSVICFVDALDEGFEDDIRDMMDAFEELQEICAWDEVRFRTCLSSRYYPQISTNVGLEIRLDRSIGHKNDIMTYINIELRNVQTPDIDEIKRLLLSRSAGIFLWVVIVVRILKTQYAHGRVETLRQKLMVLPDRLHDLFLDIAARDGEDFGEFILCLQWVLHASRPLNVTEYYLAIKTAKGAITTPWVPSAVNLSDMIRFVTSSSKGFAEATTLERLPITSSILEMEPDVDMYRVQFIHESVRDFLMDESSITKSFKDFSRLAKGPSHEQLKLSCFEYIRACLDPSMSLVLEDENLDPAFMNYATGQVLHHAEIAYTQGYPQDTLLQSVVLHEWLTDEKYGKLPSIDLFYYKEPQLYPAARLLCTLAYRNLPKLMLHQLSRTSQQLDEKQSMILPMLFASIAQSLDVAKAMLGVSSESGEDTTKLDIEIQELMGRCRRNQPRDHELQFMQYFVHRCPESLAKTLIRLESWTSGHDASDVLNLAAINGLMQPFESLFHIHRDRLSAGHLQRFMYLAAGSGNIDLIRLLLNSGISVEPPPGQQEVPLVYAAAQDHSHIVSLLLEKGADKTRKGCLPDLDGMFLAIEVAFTAGLERLLHGDNEDFRSDVTLLPTHISQDADDWDSQANVSWNSSQSVISYFSENGTRRFFDAYMRSNV